MLSFSVSAERLFHTVNAGRWFLHVATSLRVVLDHPAFLETKETWVLDSKVPKEIEDPLDSWDLRDNRALVLLLRDRKAQQSSLALPVFRE